MGPKKPLAYNLQSLIYGPIALILDLALLLAPNQNLM